MVRCTPTHPLEVKPLRLRHDLRLRRPALLRQGGRSHGTRSRSTDGRLEVSPLDHLPQPLPDDGQAVVATEPLQRITQHMPRGVQKIKETHAITSREPTVRFLCQADVRACKEKTKTWRLVLMFHWIHGKKRALKFLWSPWIDFRNSSRLAACRTLDY